MTESNNVIQPDQLEMLASSAGVDTVKVILDAFWKSTAELQGQISECVSDANADLLAQSAHALKGSASNVGASLLADLAKALEEYAREANFVEAEKQNRLLANAIAETQSEFSALITKLAA